MTSSQHLIQAERLYLLTQDLRSHEHHQHHRPVIGELIWGTIVHSLSAADPDHEIQPPDRFGNPHQAPVGAVAFHQALRRAPNLGLTASQMESCLDWGQRKLHNHYYHGNLSDAELDTAIMVGAAYAARLYQYAAARTIPPAR